MTSVAQSSNPKVNEIVDRLKKQGLFDKFRKECLADVDTKPAYLNLRQRVETAVNSYLSEYKWRPELNKNSIREKVRHHINESSMLSRGVDHIIEQVVDPKVENIFKPAIDKVVFDCLGINQEEWEKKMRLKAEIERRGNRSPKEPEGNFMDMGSMTTSNAYMPAVAAAAGLQLGPGGVYQTPYGNFMQPGYQAASIPGYPNPFPGMLPYPGQTSTTTVPGLTGYNDINTALGLPSAANNELNQVETAHTDQVTTETGDSKSADKKKKEKKKLEPLTVEDLLNIPLPKEEVKGKEGKKEKQDVEYETTECSQVEEETLVMETTYENILTEGQFSQDGVLQSTGEIGTEEVETTDQPKVYHFAWQDIGADDLSDVTVSSVHTSDVSEFADSGMEEEEEEEEDEEDDEAGDEENVTTKDDGETASAESGQESPEKASSQDETSPEKQKPKKLISLQYNYSDSEDEETKAERKSRIAKEREERTLRRQQRRAEIIAKKQKAMEEKVAAKKSEKLDTKKGTKKDQDNKEEKKKSDNKEEKEKPEEKLPPSPKKKTPSTPKKVKKTKEELKQEIREQKVQEKRMALRRRRTRNPKYFSEEFESVFTEKKSLLSEGFVEEVVMVDQSSIGEDGQTVVIDNSGASENVQYVEGVNIGEIKLPPTPTQDEQQFILTTNEEGQQVLVGVDDPNHVVIADGDISYTIEESPQVTHMTRSKRKELENAADAADADNSRASTPYSEISDVSLNSDVVIVKGPPKKSNKKDTTPTPDEDRKQSKVSETQSTPPSDNKPTRQESQRYNTNELYKPRLNYRSSKRGGVASPTHESTQDEQDKSSNKKPEDVKVTESLSPTAAAIKGTKRRNSSIEEISSVDSNESEKPSNKRHRKDSLSPERSRSRSRSRKRSRNSQSRSRSRSRSYSRSYSRSRSRSRSRSYASRSRSRSRSRRRSRSRSRSRSSWSRSRSGTRSRGHSRSRSRSRSRSYSPVSSRNSNDGSDDERRRKKKHGVPIDKVSFGEAGRRAQQEDYGSEDFGYNAGWQQQYYHRGRGRFRPYNNRGGFINRGRGFVHRGRGGPPPPWATGGPPSQSYHPTSHNSPDYHGSGWRDYPPGEDYQDYDYPPYEERGERDYPPQGGPDYSSDREYPPESYGRSEGSVYSPSGRSHHYRSRSQESGRASSPDDHLSQGSHRSQSPSVSRNSAIRSRSPPRVRRSSPVPSHHRHGSPVRGARPVSTPPYESASPAYSRSPSPGEIVDRSPSPEYRPRVGGSPTAHRNGGSSTPSYHGSQSPPTRPASIRSRSPPSDSSPLPPSRRPPPSQAGGPTRPAPGKGSSGGSSQPYRRAPPPPPPSRHSTRRAPPPPHPPPSSTSGNGRSRPTHAPPSASSQPVTRTMRRRSEEESAPIAKRLRKV